MITTVSVIMSVHNTQKFLYESVQSILEQSLEDFEFIIINDASTDNSRKVVNEFLDKRIKIFDNKERIGLTRSLNIAIQHSKSSYIARMDGDDIAHPDRLKKQVSYLKNHSRIGIVGANFSEIDENGKILGEVYFPESDEQIRRKIFRLNPFFHSSVMIPSEVLRSVGLYNAEFHYAQDYELWFRILGKYKGANLRELLMKRRKHKKALTQKKLQLQSYFAYRACIEGRNHIKPSPIDKFWIFRYLIMSKGPSRLLLLFNKLRPHNLRYYFSGHYIRKLQ